MKKLLLLPVLTFLSGCYTTNNVVYTEPSVIHQEPVVVHQQPVCYQKSFPVYAKRQIIVQPDSSSVITGSAVGAVIGHELSNNNKELGVVIGAIVGGSVANTPTVKTEKYVIGSELRTVCN